MLNCFSTLGSRPPSLSFQGTFLERGQDDVIASIEERIARWTLLPVGNGEGLQVGGGAWGVAHFGFFCNCEQAGVWPNAVACRKS